MQLSRRRWREVLRDYKRGGCLNRRADDRLGENIFSSPTSPAKFSCYKGRAKNIDAPITLARLSPASGRPLRLALTPGNTSDIKAADLLVGQAVSMKRLIADRGYDANALRAKLRDPRSLGLINQLRLHR